MPLIFCSITCVTVSSRVFAEAPGKVALMVTVGAAIAGYCATGSDRMASTPASIRTMAMTNAKIGRSMKNLAMARAPVRLLWPGGCGLGGGRDGDDFGAGAYLL